MFTVQSLRGVAADHERKYELLLKDFPPGTVHDGRNEARDVMERAIFCADWMERHGIESARDVGPFMSMSLSRGDKVRLLKGARVFGTGSGITREGTVNPRNRIIKVFSFDRGHIAITLKPIRGSAKSSHQQVMDGEVALGSVWREQVDVAVSKLTEPRRMAKRWRWFSQGEKGGVHGRGTRAALIFGAGYRSRNEAVDALVKTQSGVAA